MQQSALAAQTTAEPTRAAAAPSLTAAAPSLAAATVAAARMQKLVSQLSLAEYRPCAYVGTKMRVEHVRRVRAVLSLAAAQPTAAQPLAAASGVSNVCRKVPDVRRKLCGVLWRVWKSGQPGKLGLLCYVHKLLHIGAGLPASAHSNHQPSRGLVAS